MFKLNLPDYSFKLRKAEGKVWIFDGIRKKYIVLTAEEWVRQHFVNYIINHLNYPKTLIKIESGLQYNQRAKRTDIVVYNRNGLPWMVIECKAPEQALDEKTIHQAAVYNATLKAPFIVVTNGLAHRVFRIDFLSASTQALDDFPVYE